MCYFLTEVNLNYLAQSETILFEDLQGEICKILHYPDNQTRRSFCNGMGGGGVSAKGFI